MPIFRLQRVLDLRRRREDEQRQRFATATQARMHAEQRLAALIDAEHEQRQHLSTRFALGPVSGTALADTSWALKAAEHAIAEQRREVEHRLAAEQEERARLATAMSERKALERLREHHDQRMHDEANRREAATLSEIATARAARAMLSRTSTR